MRVREGAGAGAWAGARAREGVGAGAGVNLPLAHEASSYSRQFMGEVLIVVGKGFRRWWWQ